MDNNIYNEMEKSSIYFLKQVWNLTPQPLNKKYKQKFLEGLKLKGKEWDEFTSTVTKDWFAPFEEGKHITWQQALILFGVDKAIRGDVPLRISIVSGHGIGKSMSLSILILWFLFVHPEAQIACTSPGKEQLYDVLWKEIKKWIDRAYPSIGQMYVWEASHIRMKESPQTWFARAKTASKENTEALAGVHADWVMMAVDEACHDDKTEVLTNNGWKFFKDLKQSEMVMTLSKKGKGEFQRPTLYHEYDHNGEMIASNLRAADFVVTKNHKLYGKTKNRGYVKFKAEDINGTDRFIPRTINWTGVETISPDMMRLAGWFLSEGSFKKYKNGKVNSIVISQSPSINPKNFKEIIQICERLGYSPKVYKSNIYIHNVVLANKFLELGDGFKNKNIPKKYKKQSPRLLAHLLDTFMLGDGYIKKNREILYTSSKSLADDLQEIILKTGFNSTVILRKIKGQKKWIKNHWATTSCDGYVISRTYNNSHIKINHKKIKKIKYIGKVYCVTVPNGIFMTRRNGKVMWSGNSGVDEAIFETMEGSLTSGNILVFLISNGTRSTGYFFDTHNKDNKRWQNYHFSSLDSPRVDQKYVDGIIDKYGEDSIQYAIRVLGQFPKEDGMDDSGYVPLLPAKSIRTQPDFGNMLSFSHDSILGVDPAGDGDDKTSWVLRDRFKAKKLFEETKSTSKTIAEKTMTLMLEYNIKPYNVIVDAFGTGMDVGKEIAIASKGVLNVTTVNTGDKCNSQADKDVYLNKRAEIFYKAKTWLQSGGELVENGNFKDELCGIRYKRNLAGKIQIMPKTEMKKRYGLKSPNDADAFSLTFLAPDFIDEPMERKRIERNRHIRKKNDYAI